MKQLDFKNTKKKYWMEYNDGDIILIDDITTLKKENFKQSFVNMVAMIFCLDGKSSINMNGKTWNVEKNDVLILAPGTFVDDYIFSEDFNAKIIGFSVVTIDSAIYLSKNVWQSLYYVLQNPVIHLEDTDMKTIYHYYSIAEAKMDCTTNIYHKEIMHSLLLCLIYEFLIITNRYNNTEIFFENAELKQGDLLLKRFVELLVKEKGMIRSVSDAAYKLNVSSKYLSATIKSTSGKNALEFIHHYTVQEVIRRLKYTDKSIQEISNDMNFPSISFFGKFFKNQMGISPKQYRKNGGEISH
ncbi:MAG: AraC family transcriptional regulator [Bacteroidales bacterium]